MKACHVPSMARHPRTPFDLCRNPGWGYNCPHCVNDTVSLSLREKASCVNSAKWQSWDSNTVVCRNSAYTGVWGTTFHRLPLSQGKQSLCLENPRERPKPCGLQAPGPHAILSQSPGDRGSHAQRQKHSTSRGVVVTQKSLLQKYFASQKV